MNTIKSLEREHRWIDWMADCLDKLIVEARAADQLPVEAADLLYLYESFADGRHQQKEEEVLFPELLDAANEDDRKLLLRLLHDHEDERRHMERMRLNLLGALQGELLCVRSFTREASEYLDVHRAHMLRENNSLFPLAERLLTPESDARVVVGFAEVEGGPGDPHGLGEQILELARRVGLPAPPAA